MTSFCLHKVNKAYEADHVSERKSTHRIFNQLACLSNITSVYEIMSITFIQLNLNASCNCYLSKSRYRYISIYHPSNL